VKTRKEIVMFETDTIIPAMFNPPTRTLGGSLSSLKKSIEEIGIIYPLLTTPKRELIDGHRRLACAKVLGINKVPVIVITGDADRVFDDVNRTVRKLGTSEQLFVYLAGGPISASAKKPIQELEELIGKKDLEFMAENRLSANSIVDVLGRLRGYLGDMTSGFWKTAARWLIYNKQQFAIRIALKDKIEKGLLVAAIEANTPIG
jgi:hypothetical protein